MSSVQLLLRTYFFLHYDAHWQLQVLLSLIYNGLIFLKFALVVMNEMYMLQGMIEWRG